MKSPARSSGCGAGTFQRRVSHCARSQQPYFVEELPEKRDKQTLGRAEKIEFDINWETNETHINPLDNSWQTLPDLARSIQHPPFIQSYPYRSGDKSSLLFSYIELPARNRACD